MAAGIRSNGAMSYEDSAGERAKWWGEACGVVYPLFMTKVWPDFTKAQPRGRLKRAVSVTGGSRGGRSGGEIVGSR